MHFPTPMGTSALRHYAREPSQFRYARWQRQSVLVFADVQRRRKLQAFARYPDHLLADMGFERDWNGSVTWIESQQVLQTLIAADLVDEYRPLIN